MRPEFFANQYGLIVDDLAEYRREMRKQSFADAIDKWFKLGNNLKHRDTIAVCRTTSGLPKLVCPNGEYSKDSVRKCLEYALEARRRVKEQLKKIGGMEFYDVHFSYIDPKDGVERFVTVSGQSGGALVPEARLHPGTLHTISMGTSEVPGIYRLEIQSIPGTGKANVSGVAPRAAVRVAFDAGAKRILLPMSSVTAIASVPGEWFARFQTGFYSQPVDAVFKALGVE